MKIYMRNPFVSVVPIFFSTLILLSLTGCGGGGNPAVDDQVFAVAIQGDGKIIAAGDSFNGGNYLWSIALARYNSNGSLDTTFGAGGKALTDFGGGARAVAIQSDGKIVAAGYSYDSPYNFLLVRYNSNGKLDAGFGSGGVVLTNMGGAATAVAIQSDNKIVAAGYFYNGIGYDFAVARYNSNGTLDATFGLGGRVNTMMGGLGAGASGIAIQTIDSKILVAGGSCLIRYNTNGTLDPSFGFGSGMVCTGSYHEQTSGVGIQSNGQILAAGSSYNGIGSYDLALTRFNIDGSPDNSFSIGGRAVTSAMSLYALAPTTVVPDPVSGKIVVAGYSQYEFVLARYNSDGTPDTSFASGGAILTTGGGYWSNDSLVRDIAVQTDGMIVVAGRTYKDDVNGYDFALARHNSNGSIDTSFGTGGKVTTGF
jgi:uncharacterized delta-60 repeat protein